MKKMNVTITIKDALRAVQRSHDRREDEIV